MELMRLLNFDSSILGRHESLNEEIEEMLKHLLEIRLKKLNRQIFL